MKCDFCRPHADVRKQRLCHVGEGLFAAYKAAAERYADLAVLADPPEFSLEQARKDRNEARSAYRAHTDGA